MGFELNLKTEWIDKETIRVSWQEPHSIYHEGTQLKGAIGYIALGLLFTSFVLPIMTGQWWFLILFPICIAVCIIGVKFQPIERSVTFGRNQSKLAETIMPTEDITRIEIDQSLQWTNLTEEEKKKAKLRVQILIWINDETPVEVSRNNIVNTTNLKIRNALDNALQTVRKSTVETEREETQGKTGEYGLPDY